VILRTRELTPDLKKRIDANNLFLCELHFKAEFIVDRKYRVISIAHDMLNDMIIVGLCFKFIEYLIAAYKLNIHIEGLIV
jgi:hypothetical protein